MRVIEHDKQGFNPRPREVLGLRRRSSRWPVLILLGLMLVIGGCSEEPPAKPRVKVADAWLGVEIADDPDERRQGLSGRKTLQEDRGMLFEFPGSGYHGFWMKNTYVALDIAFIDGHWKIRDIQSMEPLDAETVHRPPVPTRYALEVNAGWFAGHGVTVGDTVLFEPAAEEGS